MVLPKSTPSSVSKPPAPEVIIVEDDADEVSCDGGDSALGHPQVWYSFDNAAKVICGYCDREFVKRTR